jgi:hypothetical protein
MTASTGEELTVYVAQAVPPERGTPQTWGDFIAALDHGPELASLTAYIASLADVEAVCGQGALGCYGGDRLIAMDDIAFGVTPADVVRHEYGHHVAAHRLNAPWAAVEWGPKNWASTMEVCRRVEEGNAFPGNEGSNYALNPGEAWAETYRVLEERRAGTGGAAWEIVHASFIPDEAALEAARRDVLEPWPGTHSNVLRRRFTRKNKRVWTIPLSTPLDGALDVTVSLPKASLFDVTLVDGDRRTVLSTGLWSSSRTKRLNTTICGERTLYLRVKRRSGVGRVVVSATMP